MRPIDCRTQIVAAPCAFSSLLQLRPKSKIELKPAFFGAQELEPWVPPCKGTNHAFDGDVSVRRWEDVRERFEDSPKTPEIQDMGSYRDSEKA